MSKLKRQASSSSKLRSGVDAGLLRQMGDATVAVFLLRDYDRFALTERVGYHIDLIESHNSSVPSNKSGDDASLATETEDSMELQSRRQQPAITCGVTSLLDFAPALPWHRLSKRQKRALKTQLRSFNAAAEAARSSNFMDILCYQPKQLPLSISSATRVFFAYEATRIAFCVDASPSMTSTFGINGSSHLSSSSGLDGPCCPLDILPKMARTFFSSLVEPVSAPSLSGAGMWNPALSVSVIAVYPLGKKSETSLLVRDYQVDSVEAASNLADQIQKWIQHEVEVGISERLNRRYTFSAWSTPLFSSSLGDILAAGDYALSMLSSDARPIIVVATDGRSISCDGVVDVFLDVDRVDVPIVVLDVSLPETHVGLSEEFEVVPGAINKAEWSFLTYDPGGSEEFPLHLSDDTEALYGICRATGGFMLDRNLLREHASTVAGQQGPSEMPSPYHYAYKRRFLKMNEIQWLTLFSMSPLSPAFHSSSGKLAPPSYLQRRLSLGATAETPAMNADPLNFSRHDLFARKPSDLRRMDSSLPAAPQKAGPVQTRMTFSTYFVSSVRIKALLVVRIKEGYRARQYIMSSKDASKAFIQFTLPLELGTALHYELSFKALPGRKEMVGSAHIKIELSGESAFVQSVKNDFLRQGPELRPFTMAQKVSARLCQVMRWIRIEDILQSHLSPPSVWSDQLSSPELPLARRLGAMTALQRCRHFRSNEFDVICTGHMPYAVDEGTFLSEFISSDTGEHELVDLVNDWSTQVVNKEEFRYVKAFTTADGVASYCLIELRQSQIVPRLFTVILEFIGGTDSGERLLILAGLKSLIEQCKDVGILAKQMGPFLLGTSNGPLSKRCGIEFQYHHAQWDLVKDPELLPLVMKRRIEIGRFRLLQSDDHSAIFAKVVPEESHSAPGDLIQYQIAVHEDKVVVDMHMESECGLCFPFGLDGSDSKRFNGMVNVVRRRDQECGRALRSRRNLLQLLKDTNSNSNISIPIITESHTESVKRILQYSSKVTRKIRFFHSCAGAANDVLYSIIESLLLSESFSGSRAAKLNIECSERIKGEEEGFWFVIQFDRDIMSIVHLSSVDRMHESQDLVTETYRNLAFFTSGISDLYSKRDDSNDDDSIDTHISEYMCVTEFAENFESAGKGFFASAAYLALRDNFSSIERFEDTDFDVVQNSLKFVEAARVLVAGHGLHHEDSKVNTQEFKLIRLIQTILTPVPGNKEVLFYSGGEIEAETFTFSDDESLASLQAEDFSLIESGSDSSQRGDSFETERRAPSEDDTTAENAATPFAEVEHPIFVRFKLDEKVVPFHALNTIEQSSSLAAEISLVKDSRDFSAGNRGDDCPSLPWSHQAVVSELNILLKWYVAEQTIERLRHIGTGISQDDLKLVKKCMKRVQNTLSFTVEIYFYVSKTDMMVPASAPAGGELQVEEGFSLLRAALRKCEAFQFNPVSSGGYFVSKPDDSFLPFWCFVYIQDNDGLVSFQIYHPEGEQRALEVMNGIHEIIQECVHRVNQELLLKSLHQNRTASSLLIPSPKKKIKIVAKNEKSTDEPSSGTELFPPGIFGCPVVFRTQFDLFHRCATNPNQVARTLEATVLHSFAVSNRSGMFVYKDEDGGIFIISLGALGTGVEGDGRVELLVRGVNTPGPSVTKQLKVLLQRRLLLIAVDMLSSVLTKNPHFRVSAADLDFIRSFHDEWNSLSPDQGQVEARDKYYEFPQIVYDPTMVLLMFRQNLCGSTFFHRLNDIGYERLSPSVTEHERLERGGSILKWNQHDFTLYYNNAPTKLNQSFQGVSTLTKKGAELSRKIGNGIAIIEILLIRSDGSPVDEVKFAQPARESLRTLGPQTSSLRLKKLDYFPRPSSEEISVRIRITDTALSREFLHEWIELTLNQALVTWVIERGIEISSKSGSSVPPRKVSTIDDFQQVQCLHEQLCPGLPSLQNMLENAEQLPHPAISKISSTGVIRSSTVASKTLTMLEIGFFGTFFKDMAGENFKRASTHMRIIRVSRSSPPELVKLSWDQSRKRALVQSEGEMTEGRQIFDSPIDCPEYICFFQLEHFSDHGNPTYQLFQLYKEVMIHDGISDRSATIELLESLKTQNHLAFTRSFAFIFSVKRNRRLLFTYNWIPSLVKNVSNRLKEIENATLEETGQSSHALQYRSLRILSPRTKASDRQSVATNISTSAQKTSPPKRTGSQLSSSQPSTPNTPTRRIRRPEIIRRPKLIGKSVEGAAMQAVAASRKRASSNQFKKIGNTSARRPTTLAPHRDSSGRSKADKSELKKVDGGSKRSSRSLSGARHHSNKSNGLPGAFWIKGNFRVLYSQNVWALRRPGTRQRESTLRISEICWPLQTNQSMHRSFADLIISKSALAWNDSCPTPRIPKGVTGSFVTLFGRWIATFAPQVELLSIVTPPSEDSSNVSILLSSHVKNVRGRKCLAVVKLSQSVDKKNKEVVRCQGWAATLPRRSRQRQLKKQNSNTASSIFLEKDAAGLDKVCSDVHGSLVLESLLFDFSAAMVERAVRFPDHDVVSDDLIPTLYGLMDRYPLQQQKRIPMLNFRVFEANLVLKSYRNKLIDRFDSLTLLDGLQGMTEERDIIRCGTGLCFQRGISVKGSHSICFLTPDAMDVRKMKLIILCRTQGRNLSDYMFREGSNVAIHILDNIVYEAAGLVYEELRFIAARLHKEGLWKSFSTKSIRSRKKLELVHELLELCPNRPVLTALGGNLREGAQEIISNLLGSTSGVDWKACCLCMKKERAFGPSWSFSGEAFDTHMFYLEACSTFLLVELNSNGTLRRADIVEYEESAASGSNNRQRSVQIITNFLLHFIWNNL